MIIYKVTNKINGKIYIGQTIHEPEYRLRKHLAEAKNEKDNQNRNITYFHNAILKYGIDNFEIETIDEAQSMDELNKKEIYWINKYNSTDKSIGYNLMSGGKSGLKSEETRQKIGEKKKENWQDEELRARMLAGQQKAVQAWQKKCEENRVELVCPYCGKTFKVIPSLANKRKYCSRYCQGKAHDGLYLIKATEEKSERVKKQHELFKQEIDNWVQNNKELIQNCPFNKISTTLSELQIISKKYGFSDWRIISETISGSQSRKDLLIALKKKCENLC